jgi:hypothetical protein
MIYLLSWGSTEIHIDISNLESVEVGKAKLKTK